MYVGEGVGDSSKSSLDVSDEILVEDDPPNPVGQGPFFVGGDRVTREVTVVDEGSFGDEARGCRDRRTVVLAETSIVVALSGHVGDE